MPLPQLDIKKNWFKGSTIEEANWDAIRDSVESFAGFVKLGLQQVGADVFGAAYPINNDGVGTLPQDVSAKIQAIKNFDEQIGPARLGLVHNVGFESFQTTDPDDSIRLVGANGQPLSPGNKIRILMRSLSTAGKLETKSIENALSLKLTGAHWGLNTHGTLLGTFIEIGVIDDGGAVPALAACMMPGRLQVSNTICFTAQASVDAPHKILVNRALAAGNHFYYPIGYIKANYTDSVVPGQIGPQAVGGAVNNSSFGSVSWNSPNNVSSSNNSYASPSANSPSPSYYLEVSAGNLSSLIPDPGAIIRGIIWSVEKSETSSTADITDARVRITKNFGGGTIVGAQDKSQVGEWSTTDTVVNYGGSSDTWGEDWSNLNVIMGMVISAQSSNNKLSEARIDYIEFTIHYDVGQATSWRIVGLCPGLSSDGVVRKWSQITSNFAVAGKPSNGSLLWTVFGNLVWFDYQFGTNGTSNSTGYDLTMPVQSAAASQRPIGPVVDNGASQADPGRALINGSTLTFSKTLSAGTWTASGAKNARCQMFYRGADS